MRPLAVVTGSSSGIGQAIAMELASAGFDLVVHGARNRQGAEDTAQSAKTIGAQAHVVMADLSDGSERQNFFDEVTRLEKNPEALINNAGADVLTGDIRDASFEEKLQLLWNTDVMGTISLSRWFAKQMIETASNDSSANVQSRALPTIVNMGWDQADIGMEADSGEMFATIKGAVMAFTKSLAKSVAPAIRVNAIAPGWIQTKWGEATTGYWDQRAKAESLLNRWGTPDDVAKAVRFLCSDDSSFINGQILPINGGFAGRYQFQAE